jgi:hypothetical protein
MSISEDVARLPGKPGKAGMISKGELERTVMSQYNSIATLLRELYCAHPQNKIFETMTEEQRRKRMGSILKRVLRAVRLGK